MFVVSTIFNSFRNSRILTTSFTGPYKTTHIAKLPRQLWDPAVDDAAVDDTAATRLLRRRNSAHLLRRHS